MVFRLGNSLLRPFVVEEPPKPQFENMRIEAGEPPRLTGKVAKAIRMSAFATPLEQALDAASNIHGIDDCDGCVGSEDRLRAKTRAPAPPNAGEMVLVVPGRQAIEPGEQQQNEIQPIPGRSEPGTVGFCPIHQCCKCAP